MLGKKKKAKKAKVGSGAAVRPPRSTGAAPLPEAGLAQPAPPLDLVAVTFRRQDGVFTPRGGVYKLPSKQAAKFVKQGSAVYEDKRRKKGKDGS